MYAAILSCSMSPSDWLIRCTLLFLSFFYLCLLVIGKAAGECRENREGPSQMHKPGPYTNDLK